MPNRSSISAECYNRAFRPMVGISYNLLIAGAFGGLAGWLLSALIFADSFHAAFVPLSVSLSLLILAFLCIDMSRRHNEAISAIMSGDAIFAEVVEVVSREVPEHTRRTSYAVFRHGMVVCAGIKDKTVKVAIIVRLEKIGRVKVGDNMLFLHDKRHEYPILVGPRILCILAQRRDEYLYSFAKDSIEKLGGEIAFDDFGSGVHHSALI